MRETANSQCGSLDMSLFVFKKQSLLCFNDNKKKTIKIEMISTNIESLN